MTSLRDRNQPWTSDQVAVLFWRLGPYHHARLRAAGSFLPIAGIEACGIESVYAWDKIEGSAGFKRITLTDSWEPGRAWSKRLRQRVSQVLDELRPAAVAVPGWSFADAISAMAWCVSRRVPAVCMSDSTPWGGRRKWWKEATKRRVVSLASSALVAGSPHRDYLLQLGMPRDRIFLGYDAVDNRYFEDKAEEIRKQKAESRNRYGLPERYFLASARFIEEKNLPRLLQAYALYRQRTEDRRRRTEGRGRGAETLKTEKLKADGPWDLVLLGDGPLRAALNYQLSTLNLHGHVLMPGFKQYPDLPAYYALAKALILPSISETWGLVVNEAMASGLAVLVSSRCGCAPDLVQEGVNGFTFDPYNVEQLAGLMLKLSTLSSQLSTMGAASRRIIANWGPERFATALKAAVDYAVRVGPKPAGVFDRMLLNALIYR